MLIKFLSIIRHLYFQDLGIKEFNVIVIITILLDNNIHMFLQKYLKENVSMGHFCRTLLLSTFLKLSHVRENQTCITDVEYP